MGIFGSAAHYSIDSVTPIASSAEVGNGHGNELDNSKKPGSPSSAVVELDAADLLAKYTNYYQVCGKGFKRVANLRMHMRAHGDEYKTNAALCNPMMGSRGRQHHGAEGKYSCMPFGRVSMDQEPCQVAASQVSDIYIYIYIYMCQEPLQEEPLPEDVYVCNQKKFSVLSDLRTHEKHCGDLKWMCSCARDNLLQK